MPADVIETGRKLLRLQQIDRELAAKRRDGDELPAQIQIVLNRIEAARAEMNAAKAALVEHQKSKRQIERDIQEQEDRIRKSELKAREVKTNKEYQAALKEIEALKAALRDAEDRLLALMETDDAAAARSAAAEKEFEIRERGGREGEAALRRQLEALGREMGELEARRRSAAEEVPAAIRGAYDRILAQREGWAVAELSVERCPACNMQVPPQMANEVRKGQELHQCPSCLRFLVWKSAEAG